MAGLKQTEETITLSKGRYLYVVGLICIMIQVHPLNLKESNGVSRFGLSNSTFQISVRQENTAQTFWSILWLEMSMCSCLRYRFQSNRL